MPPPPSDQPRSSRGRPAAEILIAAGATISVLMAGAIGLLSLPGLAFTALVGGGALVATIAIVPQALVLVPAALFPLPLIWAVFPYELAFGLLALVVLAHALIRRDAAFLRLTRFEMANVAFVGWALFTALWATDGAELFLGSRRLLEGLVTQWVAYRLARFVHRTWFEASLVLLAVVLTLATFQRRLSLGTGIEGAAVDRASATDLGWGTSNFIATVLLLLAPPLIEMVRRHHAGWMRGLSAATVAAIGILQVLIASRAATVLFFAGLLAQLMAQHVRRNLLAILATVAGAAVLLSTPIGERFVSRFSDLRELGSIVVRLWYFREGWQRVVDHLPWGLGLGQGMTYPDKLQNIDPHNYWLVVGSELGTIGAALWVIVLVILWRRIRVVTRTPGWHGVGHALHIAFWLGQLHTLVEPTFQGVQYQYVYFWLFAGYLGYHDWECAQARGPDSSISR